VLVLPEVSESKALQPNETLPATGPTAALVQPRRIPNVVGVALAEEVGDDQTMALPLEAKT